jgi:predicted AAA+ superfamily ATPase
MDIIKQDPVYDEYISLLSQIKTQIKVSRVKATLSINAEMLYSYWFTGKTIIYMPAKGTGEIGDLIISMIDIWGLAL